MQLYRLLNYDTEVLPRIHDDQIICVDTQPPFYIEPVDVKMKSVLRWLEEKHPDAFWDAIKEYR